MEHFTSTNTTSDAILDSINQINSLKDTRIEKERKISETDQNVVSIKENISSLEESIKKIKSSDDYKKYLELKNNLNEFSTQKNKIKNEINTQFTKISRPLSRYEYASSLDKEQKTILSKLNSDPFEVLLPQTKDSVIVILENVRKGITSGSISVKDIDKTLSQITETEESLDVFVNHISEYFEKYNKLKNDLDEFAPKELHSLENELTKNITSKEDAQLKSETLQGEIDEIDSKIPQIISEIEQKLRNFSNTKYTVLSS